jgi:hypothetical protein
MTGFLESWSLQLRNDTKMSPQLKSFFFFHRHIYSLCCWDVKVKLLLLDVLTTEVGV